MHAANVWPFVRSFLTPQSQFDYAKSFYREDGRRMSKAVPSSSIDLTTDEPVPVPSGKKRRLSNEVDLSEAAPARGPSQRIAHNEVTKETKDLKAQLHQATVVEASLFNKLEKMEKRADNAEEKLRALKQANQAAAKQPAAAAPKQQPVAKGMKGSGKHAEELRTLRSANKRLRKETEVLKKQLGALRRRKELRTGGAADAPAPAAPAPAPGPAPVPLFDEGGEATASAAGGRVRKQATTYVAGAAPPPSVIAAAARAAAGAAPSPTSSSTARAPSPAPKAAETGADTGAGIAVGGAASGAAVKEANDAARKAEARADKAEAAAKAEAAKAAKAAQTQAQALKEAEARAGKAEAASKAEAKGAQGQAQETKAAVASALAAAAKAEATKATAAS